MKMNDKKLRQNIGAFIRKARIDKSLTGAEFGYLLQMSQQQISRYETGLCGITIDMLDTMLNVLDKSWDDFIRIVINKKNNNDLDSINENIDDFILSCRFQ